MKSRNEKFFLLFTSLSPGSFIYHLSSAMRFILVIFILLFPILAVAQQVDSQLAYTYYQNKEYDKAADLFLKLYERNRSSGFLDYYLICLINGKQYDKAEEVLKKFLKADDNNKDFLINLGYIYEQQGKSQKAEEYYEKAVKKLIPNSGDINSLANRFREIREYSWAAKTYRKGRELMKQPDGFLNELGDCYMMERDFENMFALFARSLETRPTEINNITSKLSFARTYDIGSSVDAVIESNLKKIFVKPGYNPAFDELAVWYALQKNDYSGAMDHATKLNQKQADKLYIFLNIARNAALSGNYTIAKESYAKVLAQGKENNGYYDEAEKQILRCKYEECEQQKADVAQYDLIAKECRQYIQTYGTNFNNIDIILLLSDLYAYRLNQSDSANILLQKAENIRMIGNLPGTIKSKRADLLVFMDNPWEATILYTQIEKANPNNDIGYEAKLKKARLAYFAGDLLWAKAQFDVLKGATSKLISNDAIKMSHFINANYEEEGDNSELEKLATTEYLIYRKQEKTALPALDSIIRNNQPGIADYASLLKAKLLAEASKYTEAEAIFQKLQKESGQIYIQAEAIFELAALKVKTKDKAKALELYKTLVTDYSGSVYSIESSRIYRELEKTTP